MSSVFEPQILPILWGCFVSHDRDMLSPRRPLHFLYFVTTQPIQMSVIIANGFMAIHHHPPLGLSAQQSRAVSNNSCGSEQHIALVQYAGARNQLNDPEQRASLDENKSRDHLLVKLHIYELAFHKWEVAGVDLPVESDRYRFVPFPNEAFVDMLFDAFFSLGADRSKRFLDVGSGFGSKVLLASTLFDAYGFDCIESYVNEAQRVVGNRVILADAFTYDRYDEFDVVYYYRPIHDDKLYHELERRSPT